MNSFWREVLAAMIIGMFIGAFIGNWERDSTDDPTGDRSGMGLYIDSMTGCHYLGKFGGLTPRLDREGNHVCHQE